MRFRLYGLLVGVLLLAAPVALWAQTTTTAAPTTTTAASTTTTTTSLAVVWQVVLPTDCTADLAAAGLTAAEVTCCTQAGAGQCNELFNFGHTFERFVTFASGATGGYTSGGDLISATQLARIGLSRISHAICYGSTNGRILQWRPTTAYGQRAPKIQLFTSGGTELSGATSVAGEAFKCLLFGYQ